MWSSRLTCKRRTWICRPPTTASYHRLDAATQRPRIGLVGLSLSHGRFRNSAGEHAHTVNRIAGRRSRRADIPSLRNDLERRAAVSGPPHSARRDVWCHACTRESSLCRWPCTPCCRPITTPPGLRCSRLKQSSTRWDRLYRDADGEGPSCARLPYRGVHRSSDGAAQPARLL